MAIHAAEPLDVVVGWMDALRRGDIDEVERWFDPDVTWRGVRDAAFCRNRDEVLDMLHGSLEGRLGADAVEVIAGEGVAVLAVASVGVSVSFTAVSVPGRRACRSRRAPSGFAGVP